MNRALEQVFVPCAEGMSGSLRLQSHRTRRGFFYAHFCLIYLIGLFDRTNLGVDSIGRLLELRFVLSRLCLLAYIYAKPACNLFLSDSPKISF